MENQDSTTQATPAIDPSRGSGIVTKLPTAPTSYYTVNKAGRFFDVVLVTPCPGKALKTSLRRWHDREAAIADAKAIAAMVKRPVKIRGVV